MLKLVLKAALTSGLLVTAAVAADVAPTPPMGWNSWDSYGLTIGEEDYRANVSELAKLQSYGWTYAVIDEGWYMGNPNGDKLQTRDYILDRNGLTVPAPGRFPSAAGGLGFKPLADWVHGQGLKFGLHIVRGIPKQAVDDNSPIAGSSFHAAEAADKGDVCQWDDGNYGIRDNPAGQAYYDSMLALYAKWGVDFLKVDCIADHPYKGSEIRQIAAAIDKSGRPIVLSLSPGPTNPSHADEIRRYSQMWRISNDDWDGWQFTHDHPEDTFPTGLRDLFDLLPAWAGQARDGRWPDADMLPFGTLAPHPGWGEARRSRLSSDEQRTQLTLLAIARSPLILGANLTKLDDATRALITNSEILAVDQASWDNHPIIPLPPELDSVRVWSASGNRAGKAVTFLAVFNLGDKPLSVDVPWDRLGLTAGDHIARDLWEGRTLQAFPHLKGSLPPHGSLLYAVE